MEEHKIFKDILELIGHTPIVEVKSFDIGPCRLFLKLENMNPSGAIKDRIGLSMIEAAERQGKLKEGYTLIEATAGNTGLGLALVAARKGYRLLLIIPDAAYVAPYQFEIHRRGDGGGWTKIEVLAIPSL